MSASRSHVGTTKGWYNGHTVNFRYTRNFRLHEAAGQQGARPSARAGADYTQTPGAAPSTRCTWSSRSASRPAESDLAVPDRRSAASTIPATIDLSAVLGKRHRQPDAARRTATSWPPPTAASPSGGTWSSSASSSLSAWNKIVHGQERRASSSTLQRDRQERRDRQHRHQPVPVLRGAQVMPLAQAAWPSAAPVADGPPPLPACLPRRPEQRGRPMTTSTTRRARSRAADRGSYAAGPAPAAAQLAHRRGPGRAAPAARPPSAAACCRGPPRSPGWSTSPAFAAATASCSPWRAPSSWRPGVGHLIRGDAASPLADRRARARPRRATRATCCCAWPAASSRGIGDSMLLVRGGPGLWVVAQRRLLVLGTMFLPASSAGRLDGRCGQRRRGPGRMGGGPRPRPGRGAGSSSRSGLASGCSTRRCSSSRSCSRAGSSRRSSTRRGMGSPA